MSEITSPPTTFEAILERIGIPKMLIGLIRVLTPPGVRLSGAGIQFLSTVMIARQLGDASSAGFFFWSAVLTSFAPVATFGLEHLVLRTVPRLHDSGSREKVENYLSSIRTFTLILSAAIGIALFVYAIFRNEAEGAGFHFWHLLLPVALCAMAIVLINGEALKGLSRPVAGVFFGHFVPVSLFCLLIAINFERLTAPFLICIYTAAYVLAIVFTRFGPSKSMRARLFTVPTREQTKTNLNEGFPVFATNALGALCYIVPLMVLDFARPAAEVAYVTTSFRISILCAILAAAIHGVFAPQLSRAAAIPGNAKGVWKVYRRTTFMTLLALAIPYGIGIAFPDWVMSIFGQEFRAGASTLRFLLISGLVTLGLGPMLQLLLMTGNTVILARLGVVKLVLVSVLSAALIPKFGGNGMVIAMAVAFLLEEIAGLLYVGRQLQQKSTEPRAES